MIFFVILADPSGEDDDEAQRRLAEVEEEIRQDFQTISVSRYYDRGYVARLENGIQIKLRIRSYDAEIECDLKVVQ